MVKNDLHDHRKLDDTIGRKIYSVKLIPAEPAVKNIDFIYIPLSPADLKIVHFIYLCIFPV